MEEKKYILTDEVLNYYGHTLHRIQAVRDFGNVKAGDLGGWVESEGNLSHQGDCWIGGEAKVFENGRVSGDASVFDHARVCNNALVTDSAVVYGDSFVSDMAYIHDAAQVRDMATIGGEAVIGGRTFIADAATIFGNAKIEFVAIVRGNATIYTGTIRESDDYLVIGPIGSRNDYTTFFRSNGTIFVKCGCFKGKIEEFWEGVKERHTGLFNQHRKDYKHAIDLAVDKLL